MLSRNHKKGRGSVPQSAVPINQVCCCSFTIVDMDEDIKMMFVIVLS